MRDMCKARTKHKAQIPKMGLIKVLIKCKEHVEFYFHKWIVVIHLREGWNLTYKVPSFIEVENFIVEIRHIHAIHQKKFYHHFSMCKVRP
jgi:hypothetical protein